MIINSIMVCPRCGRAMINDFCENCGYVHVIPKENKYFTNIDFGIIDKENKENYTKILVIDTELERLLVQIAERVLEAYKSLNICKENISIPYVFFENNSIQEGRKAIEILLGNNIRIGEVEYCIDCFEERLDDLFLSYNCELRDMFNNSAQDNRNDKTPYGGLGFGIITNSFSSAVTYSVMDAFAQARNEKANENKFFQNQKSLINSINAKWWQKWDMDVKLSVRKICKKCQNSIVRELCLENEVIYENYFNWKKTNNKCLNIL